MTDERDEPTRVDAAGTRTETYDVLVVGGGVAGLTAGLFCARAGLGTAVVNHGESILRRNAHLENVPGFPAGVNPRLFLDMLEDQSRRNGCDHLDGRVTALRRAADRLDEDDGPAEDDRAPPFVAQLSTEAAAYAIVNGDGAERSVRKASRDPVEGPDELRARRVVAASWSDASYLDGLDVDTRQAGSKRFIRPDGAGRTGVKGLYAAGRLAEQYHQTIVSAGHGAQVAITLVHDADVPYYHDWVAPEGYFTDRGREVPPGCEEIGERERRARERESMAAMSEYFSTPHPDPQRTHPSLADE